ncbi:voltage-dependent calcium channel subunit alpha-2/delta-4 isoform X2 [Cimex lectularius]|uniref:VWFA domain-containing protein n=1 Tax=Cimex lectularius TaxID=79782 RepID=A0A8I6RM34_CIMLE|nr:voltage-dependent calcium channel subunit alpha-2/delta-4 isoform X2 [Cimex lectularius]
MHLSLLLAVVFLPLSLQQDEDIPHNEVKNWALKFGVDLWEFGRQFTKMNEIQRKYHDHDAEVGRKDGLLLIREMATEVKNMMDIKMNSIRRIMDIAEQAALSYRLESEGASVKFLNSRNLKKQPGVVLEQNRHFDRRHVNTSVSSVIMPAFLSESDIQVANALRWSEHLDPVFVNNYEVDPAVSWQYFGSSTGFLRRFPAMQWPPEESKGNKELHDFRTSNWYVGASTSPKDLAIMMEVSSSMSSNDLELAKLTVKAIINTLGDDDFVNVFTFAETTKELLHCFKDLLVQANEINKRELIVALDSVQLESGANFSAALVTGFEILHRYNQTSQGCQCNQALMLVTMGPKGDLRHIFKAYNWPHMPVRVFTYLIGKDKSNAAELFWIACSNKGYYENIDKPETIKEKVQNYLRVMSRPMVMYQSDHPIHWTPVYTGGQTNTLVTEDIREGQLMTTVSTPIFDRRNGSERTANLLGVVGTDIPIQQIKKLVPPYKLGVNGYSFIVNNNGHVLYHPDLRPFLDKNLFVETLKPNYNSVDLTSVELLEDDINPRDNNSILNDLRTDMINQREGETDLKVKVHYDEMRRVTTRRHKYFYHPIEGTPFTLGLALPDGYGLYEVLAEQEIKLSQINVTEYFKGNNWRVHPDWVYCEYNYAGEHNFSSPEEQVLHFLSRTRKPGWKWMSLRPRSPTAREHEPAHANTKKTEKDSYYCDKTLMQSLVFDAMVTDGLERPGPSNLKEDKQQGYQMFGETLSFIATRSGLIRWQEHALNAQDEQSFAAENRLTLDEVWFKRAVDQHTIEPESFVFSVPFDAGSNEKTLVTATHAIFLEHKGHKAPAAVVGLQFQHSTLSSHFRNVTSACTGNGCKKTCASEELDCYVLDNNGFIILSEKNEHTGMFFGQADGTIMDSLVQDGIYKKVPVMDYQGACSDSKSHYSDASKGAMPWEPLHWIIRWFFTRLTWLIAQSQVYYLLQPIAVSAQEEADVPIYSDYEGNNYDGLEEESPPIIPTTKPLEKETLDFDEQPQAPQQLPVPPVTAPRQPVNRTTSARPCTKKVDLYVLQPGRLNNSGLFNPLKGKLTNCHITGCERPFSVQKIPHSNLILLVVDTLCPCGSKQLSISAQEINTEDGGAHTCRPSEQGYYRRRPPKCINYHPEEIEIKQCGRGEMTKSSLVLVLISVITLTQYT